MAEYDAAGGDKAYLWRLHRILAMYVLMATGDKIEIWDSNKYKQLFDSISSDALSDLGNQVLGGKQDG